MRSGNLAALASGGGGANIMALLSECTIEEVIAKE
jgi:hypothetical protein